MLFAVFGTIHLPFYMVFPKFKNFKILFAWYLLYFGSSNIMWFFKGFVQGFI